MAHHGGRSVSMTSCTAYNSKFLQMKYDGILQILPTPDLLPTTPRSVNGKKKYPKEGKTQIKLGLLLSVQEQSSINNICWMECLAFSCPCYRDHFMSSGNREICNWRLIGINALLYKFYNLVKFALHSMLKFCAIQLQFGFLFENYFYM